VSSVKYELGFYISEDDILHSHRRENLKSYRDLTILVAGRLEDAPVKSDGLWGILMQTSKMKKCEHDVIKLEIT
jgi:hypothetical protein